MTAARQLYLLHGTRRVAVPTSRLDASGAFVKSSLLLEKGEQVDFEIEVDARVVRGTATVKGLLTGGAVPGMILEFGELDEHGRLALATAAAKDEEE